MHRRTNISTACFVADYAVKHTVSWNDLNTANLIFGKDYAAGSVDYTLRAPSVGSDRTGLNESSVARPKATNGISYWTRTTDISKTGSGWLPGGKTPDSDNSTPFRAVRGFRSARGWDYSTLLRTRTRTSVSAPSLKS